MTQLIVAWVIKDVALICCLSCLQYVEQRKYKQFKQDYGSKYNDGQNTPHQAAIITLLPVG